MTRQSKNWLIASVVVLIAAYYVWFVFFSGDVYPNAQQSAANRQTVRTLYDGLALGIAYDEVLNRYWQARADFDPKGATVELRVISSDEWLFDTPTEFVAKNLVVRIAFEKQITTAIELRNADGIVLDSKNH